MFVRESNTQLNKKTKHSFWDSQSPILIHHAIKSNQNRIKRSVLLMIWRRKKGQKQVGKKERKLSAVGYFTTVFCLCFDIEAFLCPLDRIKPVLVPFFALFFFQRQKIQVCLYCLPKTFLLKFKSSASMDHVNWRLSERLTLPLYKGVETFVFQPDEATAGGRSELRIMLQIPKHLKKPWQTAVVTLVYKQLH